MRKFLIGRNSSAQHVVDCLNRSLAVIEFRPDGEIVTANENFLNALGYRLEEIQGRHHSMFVDPEEVKSADYAAFWSRLRDGSFQQAEYRRFGKGGREIWIQATYNPVVDDAGKVYKVVKFATDVTAQKLKAADYECQLQAIGKSQAVIEFDLDGTIITANENFLKAVGYSLDEIKGHRHAMFVAPEEQDSAEYRRFWAALREGEFHAGEFRRFGKGGREIWIQATYNPIYDMNGKPFKVVKYASDVTAIVKDREQRGEALRKIDAQLAEIVSLVENTANQATGAESATTQTSANVQTVAAGAEELDASVKEISSQISQALKITGAAVEEATLTNTIISSLAESAQSIGQVVELISNIADQTNLLALNATIEAARRARASRSSRRR